jgi:oligosaccharide amylase
MPRDIPIGNGNLLITFDDRYQVRDFYFPHVGQENHAGNQPCHFGIYVDNPHGSGGRLAWTTDPGFHIRQRYIKDTLTTSVALDHKSLNVSLYCNDVVDFHRSVCVRRIKIKNHNNEQRRIKVIHHQDFNMYGSKIGDTAYFDPGLCAMVHYRNERYIMVTFYDDKGQQRVDEFATGTSGFAGAEGTWRDAEDGHLQGNAIAQGAVDSTALIGVDVPAHGEREIHMVLIAATSREELVKLHAWLKQHPPASVIDRTSNYWRLWVNGTNINFGNLPTKVVDLFRRSLLVVRTQCDNHGAIIAANDTDIMQFARDTYSYMWPRDGALVADSLDMAGFPDLAKSFFTFCQKVIRPEGYFVHKYNPDGSPASSWHPWVRDGKPSLPIQEDETALVVWALWRHYYRYRDIEFIRPMWVDIVQVAADFMCDFRDPQTGLPLPSYDLWEERYGVHAFTVATVYGGLRAAHNFAVAFGDRERAMKYKRAADEVKAGAAKHLWSEKHNRFYRRLVPTYVMPTNEGGEELASEQLPSNNPYHQSPGKTVYEGDDVVDASLYAIFKFHLFDAEDPRVVATMDAVKDKLWCKTDVGGVARYERDYYHRVTDDFSRVQGNPWFICTLWLADYLITCAKTPEELKLALPIFQWTADHALESGVLAEQVHPFTNAPLSVSPLTWSHATVVSTAMKYLEKLQVLYTDETGRQIYQVKRPGTVEVSANASFGRNNADFDASVSRETASPVGKFITTHQWSGKLVMASIKIDQNECIGCGACIAKCAEKTLLSVDGKAMINLQTVDQCDLDGECVRVCPTRAVTIHTSPVETDSMSSTLTQKVAAGELANGSD